MLYVRILHRNCGGTNTKINSIGHSICRTDLLIKLILRLGKTLQVSNAYLQFLQGPGTKMLFDFVKEMPKQETRLRMDMASLIGPIFFTWVILLLFPVSSFYVDYFILLQVYDDPIMGNNLTWSGLRIEEIMSLGP